MRSLLLLACASVLLVSSMALLSVNEAWVERVNKNLLPLLNKFSIRRQGPFGLSNVIQPIVNVETLEEAQAEAQQHGSVTGTLAAAGSSIVLVIPAGQVWNVETIIAGSIGGLANPHTDSFIMVIGGVSVTPTSDFPNSGVAVFTTGFSIHFSTPLVMSAGDSFTLTRRAVGAATPSSIFVAFRRAI